MFKLTNKIALVTGAGSGIGEAIAHAFAQAGAYVIVTDVHAPHGKSVAQKIKASGGLAEFARLNVARASRR